VVRLGGFASSEEARKEGNAGPKFVILSRGLTGQQNRVIPDTEVLEGVFTEGKIRDESHHLVWMVMPGGMRGFWGFVNAGGHERVLA